MTLLSAQEVNVQGVSDKAIDLLDDFARSKGLRPWGPGGYMWWSPHRRPLSTYSANLPPGEYVSLQLYHYVPEDGRPRHYAFEIWGDRARHQELSSGLERDLHALLVRTFGPNAVVKRPPKE